MLTGGITFRSSVLFEIFFLFLDFLRLRNTKRDAADDDCGAGWDLLERFDRYRDDLGHLAARHSHVLFLLCHGLVQHLS